VPRIHKAAITPDTNLEIQFFYIKKMGMDVRAIIKYVNVSVCLFYLKL